MHPMTMENIDYWSWESSTSLSTKSNKWIRCFTPIGRDLRLVEEKQPKDFGYWNSQTRLTINSWFSSRVVAIKSLNAVVVKDHEGKTSGSILHGLVYAHECAPVVNFRIHDAKKNPSGRTGYPEKYWNPVSVSPKCSKRLGYTRYQIQV
jgi:hypothetical protein